MFTDFSRRQLGAGVLAGAALAAVPVRALAQKRTPHSADPMAYVDPELRAYAQEVAPLTQSLSTLSTSTVGGVRSMLDGQIPAFDKTVPVTRQTIPGGAGAPPVVIYVINAKAGTSRPAILHTHGGGYVINTAASDVARLQKMAAALDCVIVTVDYRLAPEVTYQGSVEDNYAGLRWLYANAANLGADRKRIAVMGESAGGGHAALLAIAARDRGEVPLAFQLLIYPMLDDRTGSTHTAPAHIGHIIWDAAANRFGWQSFLGQAPGGTNVPVAAVPARNPDLSGLPPAYIAVGGIDLFVEEDIEYARRLTVAGVPTELLVIPGAFHGFDAGPPEASIVRKFNDARLDALRRSLAIAP